MHEGELQRVRRVEITHARRVQRASRAWALVALLHVLAVAALSVVDPAVSQPALIAGLVGLGSLLATLAIAAPPLVAWLCRTRLGGRLSLDPSSEGVAIIGSNLRRQWTLPWRDVGLAWQPAPLMVEVASASGDEARMYFESPDEARAAVTAIRRRGRDRRAYPLSLESDTGRLRRKALGWVAPTLLVPLAAFTPLAWPIPPLALALGWIATRGDRRITLGADGVIVEDPSRRLYVPYREIAAVELGGRLFGGRSLALRTTDGTRVRLGHMIDATRASLAAALLNEGRGMVERGEAAGASSSALAQDGETPEAWLKALPSRAKKAGYRAVALDPERLVSIVRNPAADGAQRVAAALALRAEPSGVARIRVAAEVSTEPDVRDALEALASDAVDEVRVARALERLASARR